MEIRELEKEDMPALSVLYRAFWGEDSDVAAMKGQLEALRAEGGAVVLGAFAQGRLLGSVTGYFCRDLYGACRPFLLVENMAVAPQSRRQGVGRALLGELERRAVEAGCSQMLLVTESDREEAHRFYESMGFGKGTHSGFKKTLWGTHGQDGAQ
ncbi:MAG TPA: GNAT family N-acetyltransferase [Firmicutes bacterium]|nr:GNAT family N-acetyltransferase [Bacillota bacterium]